MTEFYVLRYLPGVPVNDRKHGETLGRWSDYASAEAAREASPLCHLLTVERRDG